MNKLFQDIPGSSEWKSIEPIVKGWSEDRKYHIRTFDGNDLLLRISALDTYNVRKNEYEILKALSSFDFEFSRPHDIGICSEGVYLLLDWISGDDLIDAIARFHPSKQYELGLEAGRILKQIHDAKITFDIFSWKEHYSGKLSRKLDTYEKCPLKYENGQIFMDVIDSGRSLIAGRPLTLHHGDYHIGNMILSTSGHVGIIDFNRSDIGDPWEEFNRIVWDMGKSLQFAAGRIDGYFEGNVPEEFFRLLSLYISSNILSSLPWAIQFGLEQIDIMTNQARQILIDFDFFKHSVPPWYIKAKETI